MENERSCCLGYRCCRITGLTIGWLGVLLSVLLIYALCEHPARFGRSIHETIFPFSPALNIVSSYSWIFGVDRNKPEFMLASLVWWGTNLCLVLACIFSYIFTFSENQSRFSHPELYFSIAMIYWICSYVVAVLCYNSIKSAQKNPEVSV